MEITWCHDLFYGDYDLRNALKSMFLLILKIAMEFLITFTRIHLMNGKRMVENPVIE